MISAMRFLREALPNVQLVDPGITGSGGAGGVTGGGARPVDEGYSGGNSEPTLENATSIEGNALHAVNIEGNPEVGFEAFLDGTQKVRIAGYHDGIPIIWASTAA